MGKKVDDVHVLLIAFVCWPGANDPRSILSYFLTRCSRFFEIPKWRENSSDFPLQFWKMLPPDYKFEYGTWAEEQLQLVQYTCAREVDQVQEVQCKCQH